MIIIPDINFVPKSVGRLSVGRSVGPSLATLLVIVSSHKLLDVATSNFVYA